MRIKNSLIVKINTWEINKDLLERTIIIRNSIELEWNWPKIQHWKWKSPKITQININFVSNSERIQLKDNLTSNFKWKTSQIKIKFINFTKWTNGTNSKIIWIEIKNSPKFLGNQNKPWENHLINNKIKPKIKRRFYKFSELIKITKITIIPKWKSYRIKIKTFEFIGKINGLSSKGFIEFQRIQ